MLFRSARLAREDHARGSAALDHVLKVEADIVKASGRLAAGPVPVETYPEGELGNALRVAIRLLQGGARVAAIKVSLNGFDTHQNQPVVHANLLRQFAEAVAAFRLSLMRLGLWETTLLMTYAEFGRRAAENGSLGTDHGTASVHFATGGRVRGGLYGEAPRLDMLADGNPGHGIDFRRLYASALETWWGLDAAAVLGGRFAPVDFIKSV